jgi:hypothetical protein
MKRLNCWKVVTALIVFSAIVVGCNAFAETCGGKKALVAQIDFEDGKLDSWQATDANAWRIEDSNGTKVLSLFAKSNYKPKVRSPRNINIYKDATVGSFTIELDMKSTKEYNPRRDLCVFFGYQDPNHFYYAHIAEKSDKVHNHIYIVNDAPRTAITKMRNDGNSWEAGPHKVKLVRDIESGVIDVFFNDMDKPVMTAVDKTLGKGKIGVGSFDDTGQFDNIRLLDKSK